MNPITAAKWFRRVVAEADAEPGNLDTDAMLDKAKTYVEQVVGPRRPGESSSVHRTRAFADLLDLCEVRSGAIRDGGDVIAMYARTAADEGRMDAAHRWYERLVGDAHGRDAEHWLLYGAFSARCGRSDEALTTARTALAVDGQHRVVLFAHAATLMAAAAVEHCDELEESLERLGFAHPRFGEGHVLAALHWNRMEMRDRVARALLLARGDVQDDGSVDQPLAAAWWQPKDRSLMADVAVRCAALLAALELVELAAVCLQCFGQTDANAFHYLMAVLHHKRGEFGSSAEHLRLVDATFNTDGQLSLLAAHNHYGLGRRTVAVTIYAELAVRRPVREHFALAYTRLAEDHVAGGRHAEALDAFYLACRVTKTPANLTSLAACLVALGRHPEAEKFLAEAVAADSGANDADSWHHMALVNTAAGFVEMAEVCRQQGNRLSSE